MANPRLLAAAVSAVCLLGMVALGRSSRLALLEVASTETSECPPGTYSSGDSTDEAKIMVSGSGMSVAGCRETTVILPPRSKPLSSLRDERPMPNVHRAWCHKWCAPSAAPKNAICESCVEPSFPGFMKQMKATEQWAKDGFGIRVPADEDMNNLARKSLSPQALPSQLHRVGEKSRGRGGDARFRAPKQSLAMIDAPRFASSVNGAKTAVARDMWRLESDQVHLEQAKRARAAEEGERASSSRPSGLVKFLMSQGAGIAASALSPAAGILRMAPRRHAGVVLAAQTWRGMAGGGAVAKGWAQRKVQVAAGRDCHDEWACLGSVFTRGGGGAVRAAGEQRRGPR